MAKGLIQGGILEPKLFNIGQQEIIIQFETDEILNKFFV